MPPHAEPSGPSLQHQLDEITANTRALVPPDRLARTEQVISELRATGIEDQILGINDVAPSFQLTATNNKPINSADLLALGSLIVKFFRGRWDPYDMTELEAWQSLQPALRERRTLFVAITPQSPRQNAFTADRHNLTFPILSDPTCTLAGQFGLAHTVPQSTRLWYRSMLVNIPFLNGDESWRLPLPVIYIIDATGTIRFVEGYADHRLRPDPAHVLAALDATLR